MESSLTPFCAAAAAIVFNAERLNALARRRWRSFSGQNYFDPNGVFWSALVSGPLLLVMFIILVNSMHFASCLRLGHIQAGHT